MRKIPHLGCASCFPFVAPPRGGRSSPGRDRQRALAAGLDEDLHLLNVAADQARGRSGTPKRRVDFVVDGQRFSTKRTTLLQYPSSVLADKLATEPESDGAYHLQGSPRVFESILGFLRDGPEAWAVPTSQELRDGLLAKANRLRIKPLVDILQKHSDPVPLTSCEDIVATSLVGQGSYGRIYRGTWSGKEVAVRVLRCQYDLRVAKVLDSIVLLSGQHPNLARAHKFAKTRADSPMPEVWIVHDFAPRGTLRSVCGAPRASLDALPEALEICAEIAEAATFLHSKCMLHGHLTTPSVLLEAFSCSKGFVCKVSDFGLAQIFNQSEIVSSMPLGAVCQVPPELFTSSSGSFAMTPKVDVYLFSRILYEVLMGFEPLRGYTAAQALAEISRGACAQLHDHVPPPLEALYLRCSSTNPNSRPPFSEILQIMAMLKRIMVAVVKAP